MKHVGLALGACVLAAGFAAAPALSLTSRHREDLLWKAGFRPFAYGTPIFQKAVQALPPHKFVHHAVNGVTKYYYLDPTICACVYVGTEANWKAYKADTATRLHMDAEVSLIRDDTPFNGDGG